MNSNRSVIKGKSVCFSVQGWKKWLSNKEVDSIRHVSDKHSSVMLKFKEENSTIEDGCGADCGIYLPWMFLRGRVCCSPVRLSDSALYYFPFYLVAPVCAAKCRAGTSPLLAAHLPNIVCSLSPQPCFSAQSPTRASSSTFTRKRREFYNYA